MKIVYTFDEQEMLELKNDIEVLKNIIMVLKMKSNKDKTMEEMAVELDQCWRKISKIQVYELD